MPLDVGLEIQRRRAELGAYNRWIVDELDPYVGRRVVDVGCGTGNILEFFLDRDLVIGLDVGEEFVELAATRFAAHDNFRAEVADITDPSVGSLARDGIDTIICVNVLEHIADDVGALRNMAQILGEGGRVVLFVPALQALHGTMDEVDGHHRRYSKRTVRAAVQAAGFGIEEIHYMNFPGMIAWFIDGRILKRTVRFE